MTVEDLFLAYIEKNLDAIKEAQDYASLKSQVYENKAWAEEQYAIIVSRQSLADHGEQDGLAHS